MTEQINYFSRDFEQFKQFLINTIKSRFSDTYKDFHEASSGMMFLELMAMLGDIFSHYIDYNVGEILSDRVKEYNNAVSISKFLGYNIKAVTPSSGLIQFYIEVPAIANNYSVMIPNDHYSFILKSTTKMSSDTGIIFELAEDIDFSKGIDVTGLNIENLSFNEREIKASQFDTDGQITHFIIRKTGKIIAGITKEYTVTLPNQFEPFKKIVLPDTNISEIIEVKDAQDELWYETNYLAQEVVFDGIQNSNDDIELVPYLLKFRYVPKRFVIDYNPVTKTARLIFGSGQKLSKETFTALSPLNYMWSQINSVSKISSLDPQQFSNSPTLGLSPYNTTLTIKYRTGGGTETNIGSTNSIRTITEKIYETASTAVNEEILFETVNSLAITNLQPILGGADVESIEELLEHAKANFATQERVVTKEDYLARLYSMPAKYGSVFKAVISDNIELGDINIYVLTLDSNRQLTKPSDNLKDNLKTYIGYFKLASERINIIDGYILNIMINYSIVTDPKKSKHKVLTNCNETLKEYFSTKNWNFEQPIIITEVISLLHSIEGVLSVSSIQFDNMTKLKAEELSLTKTDYSTDTFNIIGNIKNNIIICPKNSLFNIKYSEQDIKGFAL